MRQFGETEIAKRLAWSPVKAWSFIPMTLISLSVLDASRRDKTRRVFLIQSGRKPDASFFLQ
jgi:hypothetical protein